MDNDDRGWRPPTRARVVLAPMERGFGHTLGGLLGHGLARGAGDGWRQRVAHTVETVCTARGDAVDRLVLEIDPPDGPSPREAVRRAAALLVRDWAHVAGIDLAAEGAAVRQPTAPKPAIARVLAEPVDELGLSVRASTSLRAAGIRCIGDLIARTDIELLRSPNLGRRCLREIEEALAVRGLVLGTCLDDGSP